MPIKKTTTFEQAMSRLDEIVARLDSGEASLEESLALFSEGAELMGFCEKKLADAKLTIEKLFPEEAE
jgi:exodeoxyribonuclease VII small subunit